MGLLELCFFEDKLLQDLEDSLDELRESWFTSPKMVVQALGRIASCAVV